jgi:alanine racemase
MCSKTRSFSWGVSGDETITAETLGEWAGTINYEIVTRISPFPPRKVFSPSLRAVS